MPSVIAPLTIPDFAVIIPGNMVDTHTTQYDLEPLIDVSFADRHKTKFHLFRQENRSTIRVSHLMEKSIPNLTKPRQVWQHQISYTVSAKKNQDGSSNLNLYAYSKKRGLLNLTSRPELVYRTLPQTLRVLLHDEAKRLFEQNIRPWRTAEQPLPFLSDELLWNVYPAYFVYAGTMDGARRTLHKKIPSSLMPLLRLPDTETLVTEMFGDDAPPALYTLFERGASWQLFIAGYLFGKLVNPALFSEAKWERTTVTFKTDEIAHLRMILNRCTPQVQARLFEDYYRITASQTTAVSQPLTDLTTLTAQVKKQYKRDFPYRSIPRIKDVKDFLQLHAVVGQAMDAEINKTQTIVQTGFDQVLTTFKELFVTVEPSMEGFQVSDDEIKLAVIKDPTAWTQSNALIHKTSGLTPTAQFSARVFGSEAPFPAGSGLQKIAKGITAYGHQEQSGVDVALTFEQADLYLRDLAATLRRIAIRHQLPPTKENVTALLYYNIYYYDLFPTRDHQNRKLKPPPVPNVLYAYAADKELPPEVKRFGVKWSIVPEQMREYKTLPGSVFKDFERIIPKVHGDKELNDTF